MLYAPVRDIQTASHLKFSRTVSKNFRKGGPAKVNSEGYSFILFSKAFVAFYKITKRVRAF